MMGSMCNDDQDKEQSEEYDRDDQISANDEKLSFVNCQVNGDEENDKVREGYDGYGAEVDEIIEDDQHGVDQLNGLEHRNNNIDGNEAQKGQLAQNKSTGQVAVSDKSRTAKLVCEHCSKGFKTRYNLTVHIRTHTGDRPYKFPKCPKTFNQSTHMKQHIMSRHDKLQIGKHVCAHCARRFPSQSKLENHIRTHTGERPHKCPFNNCNKAFAQIGAMQLHYTRVHTEHRLYVCELCGNGFKTGHNLAVHTRTHTGDQTPYKCPKCVQTFNLNSNMKKHLKSQHGKLKHLCTHCDRAFQSQFKLEIHIRMHTGHKLFVCTWENCRNAYIQIQHLKDHMCSHTGEKAHKCPWKDCTKVYTHSSNCHKHFKNHIDKIPFKCPWEDCHEEFAQLKHFRVHAKHHTGNRPVKGLRSEEVEGENDEGRIINNHVQGDESSFENALPIGNEKNLLSVNGEIDDDDGDIEMVNEIEPRENQLPIQNMPNIHQPVISNKCSRTVERPCPFAWGGCTKTFTDDGHLLKHLELIHSHHHSSKHQNSNKVDQYVLHSEIVTESVQISSTLSQPLAQLLPNINKDGQYVMDSENDEIGESEMEDIDEQQIGNGEELPMADDLHRNEHGDCQLNGHKHGSNIEGADTRRDQLAHNIQSGQVVVSDKPPKGKHVCVHCGNGFKQPSALTRHIRMHTGERPYVCPHENCAKAFTQIGAMRIHHRIHTGERPHVCEQCGKTFPTNSCLTRHIRIHTLPDPTNVITAD